MSGTCSHCGLPKEFCVCETLAKEKEKIVVSSIQRKYGKVITIVDGISKDVDMRSVLRELKHQLACGGTLKNNSIELQGDHKSKVKPILVRLGFPDDQIILD